LSNSESPEFIGLVVAVLARDPALIERTVRIDSRVGCRRFGLSDIDGKKPKPLTLETL